MALVRVPKSIRNWLRHRARRRRELRRLKACDVMVLSRAKSGRTWLRVMLSRLYQQHYGLDEAQLIELVNFKNQNEAIPAIFFTHGHYLRPRFASPGWRRRFAPRKLIFLVRHPCDVAVSEYFQSTRRASDSKADLLGIDRSLSIFDFVTTSPVGLPAIIDYLNAWLPLVEGFPDALVVRYENLRRRPLEQLQVISDFLAAPFSKEEVEEAVEFASFDHLKELERTNFFGGRRMAAPRDPDDPDSFKVRRGVVGGYRDYFDPEELAQMEDLLRTRLSPVSGYAPTQRPVPTDGPPRTAS